MHCIKHRNFTKHPAVEIFRADRQKVCGNWELPQNFHARKIGEILIFYTGMRRLHGVIIKLFERNILLLFFSPWSQFHANMIFIF